MSTKILTCTCSTKLLCPVPGHVGVRVTVEPAVLVEAAQEALRHLEDAVQCVLAARAAWMGRGLPGENAIPLRLDRLAARLTDEFQALREWKVAAQQVAERRAAS